MGTIGGMQQPTPPLAQPSPQGAMKGLARSLIINGLLPWLVYHILKTNLDVPELTALLASGAPPLIDSIISIIRTRTIDIVAAISLLAILVGLGLFALGGDAKLYLIRESFFTVLVGLAFLVSLLLPKSLLFYAARQVITGNTPEGIATFEDKWQNNPQFRSAFRNRLRPFELLWGIGMLVEAAVRTYLVYSLPVEEFLAISPFVLYGITFGLFGFQLWLMHQLRKRRAAEEQIQKSESLEGSPSS